ncbi:unnamed protein product [Ambrosiozyma monospora]|uniref:Unnamed protein product n=1 Tax=Ambrosiozyma monospora TaxID=43982 RepID=A0A9W6YNV3_AMBMO|nr:unnamed protein product [Ambrosiozyma monospora]
MLRLSRTNSLWCHSSKAFITNTLHRSVPLLTRYYSSSQNDISKQPSLNQFQNPQQPPHHFNQPVPPSQQPQYQSSPIQPQPLHSQTPLGRNSNIPPSPPPPSGRPPLDEPYGKGINILRWSLAISSFLLISGGIVGYFAMTPYSAIPGDVLDTIRKIIEAESKGDIKSAIKHCQVALKQYETDTNEVNVNYTGLMVKLGQYYEMEGDFDRAAAIYKEVAEFYISALGKYTDSPPFVEEYDFVVSRMLVVANRYALLADEKSLPYAQKLLLLAITTAQKRVYSVYPVLLPFMNQASNQSMLELITRSLEEKYKDVPPQIAAADIKNNVFELPIYKTEKSPEWSFLVKYKDGWPSFIHNLLIARDTLAESLIDQGSFREGVMLLSGNANIARESFDHPVKWCLSVTKLGVILRLMTDVIESDKQYNKIDDNIDKKVLDTALNKTVNETKHLFEMSLFMSNQLKSHNIVAMPETFKDTLDKCVMVSSAGLGLIEQKDGKNVEALQHFQRARMLAIKHKSEDYVKDLNRVIEELESGK